MIKNNTKHGVIQSQVYNNSQVTQLQWKSYNVTFLTLNWLNKPTILDDNILLTGLQC